MGCTEVSDGCLNCYAPEEVRGLVVWGNHPRRRTSADNWCKPIHWNPALRPLGPIDIGERLPDWVICGGKSGPIETNEQAALVVANRLRRRT